MKIETKEFLMKNINQINKFFNIGLATNTKEDLDKCDLCIDVYNSEYEFNNSFDLYDNKDNTFELLCSEGYAGLIDNKYVYFNETNY